MAQPTALVWFRRDLRLGDNPALAAACALGGQVIPVYIDAPEEEGAWPPGAASRWWQHHSLAALDSGLKKRNSRLIVRQGPSHKALGQLAEETSATHIFWNRRYEPAVIKRDQAIKQQLRAAGLTVKSTNALLLFEPWEIAKNDGMPYRIFTPFWKTCLEKGIGRSPFPPPQHLPPVNRQLQSEPLSTLGLLPKIPWDQEFYTHWTPGEAGAWRQWECFLEEALGKYHQERDRPDLPGTSRLSPHLHFGEISPRQIAFQIQIQMDRRAELTAGGQAYLRQLGWREFAYHLLYHFPETPEKPLNEGFTHFPWAEDYGEALTAWQQGRTGIPLVDAGMRELWRTGWMHNRVRMIAASLLTKNLRIPWQEGERWFWETLVDADLASNTLGWQWVAGCGADAAPYFRVFNPVLQGKKFDPEGKYVQQWIPELRKISKQHIHEPWKEARQPLSTPGSVGGQSGAWGVRSRNVLFPYDNPKIHR
ncbi:Deoxyribodipyrimidine photo-lyase [Nitrosococcus halophilus Nc 4]|uniref:Deoxyribodipyrimidine photo-lyase n=1 Tax=Nitrosococcus halophilus (strain Nc4) TaxID=472759 RepID=D5BUQ3_NITHN|nr:deoxyribodipyrimidine photo-lyase [Nitrosococcus halophilus]ADE13453.1 Deoxyribodipyrimidine photo-lyase [Nitrosococcus halophilus Nc 4]